MLTPWKMAQMLASKLASPPGPSACQICRHASRDAYGWMSQRRSNSHPTQKRSEDMFEDDHDVDEVESNLESIIGEEKRRHKAVRFHKLSRQMNKPGAPERKLSWEAIEQIRYLKRESPEEYTLPRLAEAFSVSPDVISRVLRGKFTPTIERKLKQDSKVLPNMNQTSLKDGKAEQFRLPLTDSIAPPAMISAGNPGDLATLSSRALLVKGETRLMPSGGNVPSVSRLSAVHTVTPNSQDVSNSMQETFETDVVDDVDLEEGWDGVTLTEEELEQIAQTLQNKLSPVEQKGREFYDSDGNFLYRI